ncbi:MAG: hypothetical protein OZSIB_2778 [Candidatus Ozemobacter sibiricus]|uniref:Prepilin-type N-terminal cleavage/methylation domain-containing protein n=1 Tax=Candidatus Ozemobacter sibiricus TaxID=2268124 RepID=A0A367ZS78_9BACT|nr:MAG: hypothetical protein OZSIB_2778 [Candidatus Ozemobacter sibiricus]
MRPACLPSPARRPGRPRRAAMTIPELLIVLVLVTIIVFVAYKVFFSQARMVQQSIEFMQVNDNFRKIVMFLGNDIREATRIILPNPIKHEEIGKQDTTAGVVLQLLKQEIDPRVKPAGPLGQVAVLREVIYELENNPNPNAKTIPRYRLIRTEFITDRTGEKQKQRHEIVDSVREFVLFRTIRKPFKPQNVDALKDRLLVPLPSQDSGTGNSLLHLRVTLERTRQQDVGSVYQISMATSFYKRGKEVYPNP